MRRVLMLAACPFPTRQGTQVYIDALARALTRAGHEVILIAYGIGKGDLGEHDRAAPYEIWRAAPAPGHRALGSGPSWGRPAADALLVAAALGAVAALRRQGRAPCLIHAHNYEGALAGALVSRLAGLPLFYHAHNLMGDELETYAAPSARAPLRRLGEALDRLVPPLAHGGASVSQPALARLRALGSAPPGMIWLPPCVEPPATPAAPPPAPAPLVYMGNGDGYQGVPVMLAALRGLDERARCVIVTDDPPARWAPWLIGLEGRAALAPHGPYEEARRWLEGAQIALLPRSVSSGFPIKLINYLHAGLPVVACRGGAQGLAEDDGVVTVPDGDAAAFAEAARALLDDPSRRDALSRRAREAARRHTWSAAVDILEGAYEDTLARWRRRQRGRSL